MARSSSIINVSIIGDAKKLIGAVNSADAATGGLVKSAAKVYGASLGVRKGFDLISDSLAEADRRGDAIQRLENQLGDLSAPLVATADGFAKMGASAQDMLELEAIYADLATSAGLAEPAIAANAEALAASALAAAQVHDADPTAIIDAIGKAVGGQTRGLKQYGVDLTEAAVQQRAMKDSGKDLPAQLTATELAAARTALILEGFAPILADISSGTSDVALKQDILGAKFETVAGKIGAGLEGPVGGLLDWVNDMVDAIPGAVDGWNMLGLAIQRELDDLLAPLARARDATEGLLGLFGDLASASRNLGPSFSDIFGGGGGSSDRQTSDAYERERARNGLGG